jgi:hypothetical protein
MDQFIIERESDNKMVSVRTPSSGLGVNVTRKQTALNFDDFTQKDLENNEENIGLGYFANPEKKTLELSEKSESFQGDENEGEYEDHFMNPELTEGNNRDHGLSYEEMQQKKAFLLSRLKRLQEKGGVASRRFGVEHSLEEIEAEVLRIQRERDIDIGINYCKQGLVFFATTIEMANNNFKLGGKLDGWSGHIFNTQSDYDEVFEELYEKYASNIKTGPEIRLITMIAGSAFMFHLQKALADKAMNTGDLLGSLSKMGMGRSQTQPEMSGPSKSTEDLMRSMAGGDDSDMSDVSSVVSELPEEKNIRVPPKRRGRPKKQT